MPMRSISGASRSNCKSKRMARIARFCKIRWVSWSPKHRLVKVSARNELLAFLSYTTLNIGLTGDEFCTLRSIQLTMRYLDRSQCPIWEFHGIHAHWWAMSWEIWQMSEIFTSTGLRMQPALHSHKSIKNAAKLRLIGRMMGALVRDYHPGMAVPAPELVWRRSGEFPCIHQHFTSMSHPKTLA